MIAYRNQRPFSLDRKLPNLDSYFPYGKTKPCELRLLSVKKEYRGGKIFFQIALQLMKYVLSQDCDIALISGATKQEKLYKNIGFVPFVHLVGDDKGEVSANVYKPRNNCTQDMKKPISFLTGQVMISSKVSKTFRQNAISHRSPEFSKLLN